jgi:chromate reductase
MLQPEAYIGDAAALFNEKGELINEGTKKFLQGYADAFASWVERFVVRNS